jgi:hypothetical protein
MSLLLVLGLDLARVQPASGHLDGLGPLLVHPCALGGRDAGCEGGAVGAVHVLELTELLPDVNGEPGSDGGAQRGGLVHGGTLDGDLDDIGLCL